MSPSKPVEWVSALIERFEYQLPTKGERLINEMRLDLEKNKECLIGLSLFVLSFVIMRLIDILKTIDNTRLGEQKIGVPVVWMKRFYFNKFSPVVCKLLNVSGDGETVQHVRQLASNVLFASSINNFSTPLSKAVPRLECLIASGDETREVCDLDLSLHMHVDMHKLTRLLNEEVRKWQLLKKIHHTELVKC